MSRLTAIWYATIVVVIAYAAFSIDASRWETLALARWFLLKGLANTLIFAAAGAAIGIVGGLVLAAARLSGSWFGRLAMMLILAVQALPALLIVLGSYFTLPELLGFRISPETAAIIALGVVSSTYYCEAIRSAVASVDPLQWDATAITGIPRITTVFRVILPQALPAAVPAIGTASIVVFKLTTLLYPLGIQDFFRASVLVNNHAIDPILIYSMVTIFYFVACKALTVAVARLSTLYTRKSDGRLAVSVSLSGA